MTLEQMQQERALPLLPSWHKGREPEMDAALGRAREMKDVGMTLEQLRQALAVKRALLLLPSWHKGREPEMDAALERAREMKDVRQGYGELQAAVRLRKGSA